MIGILPVCVCVCVAHGELESKTNVYLSYNKISPLRYDFGRLYSELYIGSNGFT